MHTLYLSVYLSIHLSVYLSIYLSIYLSTILIFDIINADPICAFEVLPTCLYQPLTHLIKLSCKLGFIKHKYIF